MIGCKEFSEGFFSPATITYKTIKIAIEIPKSLNSIKLHAPDNETFSYFGYSVRFDLTSSLYKFH